MLPSLPTGYIVTNAVFLHCDVKGRPYRIQHFRDELHRLHVMADLASAGAYQMNHVGMCRFYTLAAKEKLVIEEELTIRKGLVINPVNTEVKRKLHRAPYDVSNFHVQKEVEKFGKLSEITVTFYEKKGLKTLRQTRGSFT